MLVTNKVEIQYPVFKIDQPARLHLMEIFMPSKLLRFIIVNNYRSSSQTVSLTTKNVIFWPKLLPLLLQTFFFFQNVAAVYSNKDNIDISLNEALSPTRWQYQSQV